jgi:hypothetical protein
MSLKGFFKTKEKKKMSPPKFCLYERISLDVPGSEIKEHFWTIHGIIEWEKDWWYVLAGHKNNYYRDIEKESTEMTAMAYREDRLISYKEAIKRKKEYHCGECKECAQLLKED